MIPKLTSVPAPSFLSHLSPIRTRSVNSQRLFDFTCRMCGALSCMKLRTVNTVRHLVANGIPCVKHTIGHSRVLRQVFSFVPLLYLYPDQTLNEAQSGSRPRPSTKAPLDDIAVTPSSTWYRAVFEPLDAEVNAQNQLVSQFETNGFLGWRKKTIREYRSLSGKQYTFEFLFKTAREQDQTAVLLRNKFPSISLTIQDADVVKHATKEFCSWVDMGFINQLYALPIDDTLRRQITLVAPSAWLPATGTEATPQKAQRLAKAELLEVGKFPVIIGQEDNKVELSVMDLYWMTEGYLTFILRQYRTCNIL